MKGVKFGNYHSFDSWGLILSEHEISPPQPKEKKIEIEGADGDIDYTEYFGSVKYGKRKLKFDFSVHMQPKAFMQKMSDIMGAIHGQRMQIILDDDPDWHYTGRVKVTDFTNKKGVGKITVEVDADPWMLKNIVSMMYADPQAQTSPFVIPNGRMPSIPTLNVEAGSNTVVFTLNNVSKALRTGRYIIPEFELKAGMNMGTLNGICKYSVEWQEGKL